LEISASIRPLVLTVFFLVHILHLSLRRKSWFASAHSNFFCNRCYSSESCSTQQIIAWLSHVAAW
jgi:hypothetical protein